MFHSPEWLTTWWSQYEAICGGTLIVLGAVEERHLRGLALLHRRVVRFVPGVSHARFELLGNAWRVNGVGMSERIAFILDRESGIEASDALADQILADPRWDDLVVTHTDLAGPMPGILRIMATKCGGYLRVPDRMEAWEIPLEGSFGEFSASLGPGTRARVIGSRKRLAEAGEVRERVLGAGELDGGWQILSGLYQQRWNRPLKEHWQDFYGAVALRLPMAPDTPVMSILEFEGRPISALLNLRAGHREYSILSAFVSPGVKRVSPGWMHLGMAIERAYADDLTHFDLLGGGGLQEEYKSRLGGHRSELVTLQLVRSKRLALAYRARDRLAGWRQQFRT